MITIHFHMIQLGQVTSLVPTGNLLGRTEKDIYIY